MYPSDDSEFISQAERSIEAFRDNALSRRVERGDFDMALYHAYLKTIFHQVNSSASTFALAAVNCANEKWLVRDYLLHHAGEEKSHWEWILEDLQNTGYNGADPKSEFPSLKCQNYISFNYYVAQKYPVARLGIAAVLEGIGGKYAKDFAMKVCKGLNLKQSETKFMIGHGDTDVTHSQEILDVLRRAELSKLDWQWLTYSARIAGELYFDLYSEIAKLA